LDQFTEAYLRGEDVARWMPLVQHHLDMCADCHEEFDALVRILQATSSQAP
jgi:predicted anti-sigma-YlaC factor YlaD